MEGTDAKSNQTKEMIEEINKRSKQEWINQYLEKRIDMIEESFAEEDRTAEELSKLAFSFVAGVASATIGIMVMLILFKVHCGQ